MARLIPFVPAKAGTQSQARWIPACAGMSGGTPLQPERIAIKKTHFMTQPRRIARALLSVSDKTGLIEFARALAGFGIEIVSTGGTAKALADAGLKPVDVSDAHRLSGDDGRPRQDAAPEGAWRPARDPRQCRACRRDARRTAFAPIDLLVVNLYPFEATVAKGAGFDDCIENIDIGGPAMIRAAAKNHADVAVVVEPADYARVLDEIEGA